MRSRINEMFIESLNQASNLWDNERGVIYGLAMAVAGFVMDQAINFIPIFAGAGISIVCTRLAELQTQKTTCEKFANSISNDFSNPKIQEDFTKIISVLSGVKDIYLSDHINIVELKKSIFSGDILSSEINFRDEIITSAIDTINSLYTIDDRLLFEIGNMCVEVSDEVVTELIAYNKLPRKPGSAKSIRNFVRCHNIVEKLKQMRMAYDRS